jgi:hypothetical protein
MYIRVFIPRIGPAAFRKIRETPRRSAQVASTSASVTSTFRRRPEASPVDLRRHPVLYPADERLGVLRSDRFALEATINRRRVSRPG